MKTLTHEELDRLTRELASYARSGIPMPEGLEQLSRELGPGTLRTVAQSVASQLGQGTALSQALSQAPGRIDPQLVALVHCGEISGDMDAILEFAVEHSRRLRAHRSAVLTTVVYPAFVIVTLLGALFFISNIIMPKMIEVYMRLGAELPGLTLAMIKTLGMLRGDVGVMLTLGGMGGIVFALFHKPLQSTVYRKLAVLPGFDSLVALSDTTLVMRFLERMLSRGVPLPSALAAASLGVSSFRTRKALLEMSRVAEQGNPVGGLLTSGTPATAAWLFRQAESRGTLVQACGGIASYCEERFDRLSKRTIAILEPSLLLGVALVIGMVLLAVYLPLFNIPKLVGAQ